MWLKRHKLHTKFKYSEDPIVSWKTQTHKSHHKDGTIRSEIQGCPDSKTLHKRRQQATAYLDRKHTQNNPLLLGRTRHRSQFLDCQKKHGSICLLLFGQKRIYLVCVVLLKLVIKKYGPLLPFETIFQIWILFHFQVSKKRSFSFSIRLLQNCDDMPPGRNGANNNSCSITSCCMEYPTKKKVLLEKWYLQMFAYILPKKNCTSFLQGFIL